MTPEVRAAAKSLIANRDWQTVRAALAQWAGGVPDPAVRAGRYDVLMQVEYLARPEPRPITRRRADGS